MNISVDTSVGADRSVTCDISVDGRQASVTFGGGEVTLSVPSGGGEITFTVPEALLSWESPG